MQCLKCATKFCWECFEILQPDKPYLHFENNPDCWAVNQAQDEELKQEVIDAQEGLDPTKLQLSMTIIENTANCPTCMGMITRGKQRVNLLDCDRCKIYFCFNCGKKIGTFQEGTEAAKAHYASAFCHFKPLN